MPLTEDDFIPDWVEYHAETHSSRFFRLRASSEFHLRFLVAEWGRIQNEVSLLLPELKPPHGLPGLMIRSVIIQRFLNDSPPSLMEIHSYLMSVCDQSTVSRHVTWLHDNQWVTKVNDISDSRKYRIYPTSILLNYEDEVAKALCHVVDGVDWPSNFKHE